MASEKYYEVMNTDFDAEATKSINNIYDLYNETIELVNNDQASRFDLWNQLGILRWAEGQMYENLEDFKLLHEARIQRKREKMEKQLSNSE